MVNTESTCPVTLLVLFLSLVSVPCNAPPGIQHSTLELTKSNSIFTTSYTCDGGYRLTNPASSTKECPADATSWSTPDVACELKGNMSVCSTVNTIIPSRCDKPIALLHNAENVECKYVNIFLSIRFNICMYFGGSLK